MPAQVATETSQQSRNHPLQDNNAAVLDGPEKKEDAGSEQQSSGLERGGAENTPDNGLAPNPSENFSMAGNTAAEPVQAAVNRAEPLAGNAPVSPDAEGGEKKEETAGEGQAKGKKSSAATGGGQGSGGGVEPPL